MDAGGRHLSVGGPELSGPLYPPAGTRFFARISLRAARRWRFGRGPYRWLGQNGKPVEAQGRAILMKELSACRIVLVDDPQRNLDVLAAALTRNSKLSVAPSGERARESAARTPLDLVRLDKMLPGDDDYKLRGLPPLSENARGGGREHWSGHYPL